MGVGSRASHFTQASVKKAIEAAHAAKERNFRVEIHPDGTISLVIGAEAKATSRVNSFDVLLGR